MAPAASPFSPVAQPHRGHPDPGVEDFDLDLTSGLWLEAPFVKLPPDAPPELHDYVTDIHDPRRVYAIHRASRRHDFQSLVNRFIFQLRHGCGSPHCSNSTCFTCRKRLAGKAPIRRYNSSSARILAVHLASQENPEDGLCPYLQHSKEASETMLKGLIFQPANRPGRLALEVRRPEIQSHSTPSKASQRLSTRNIGQKPPRSPPSTKSPRNGNQINPDSEDEGRRSKPPLSDEHFSPTRTECKVRERPASKDHRSFAANVFGTVAFRMLEWLTPQGHAAIAKKLDFAEANHPIILGAESSREGSSAASPKTETSRTPSFLSGDPPERLGPVEPLSPSPKDPVKSRHSSEATFRTPQSSSRPRRRKSLEPPTPTPTMDEPRSPTKSPRVSAFQPEKLGWPPKSNSTPGVTRNIPDIPLKPVFFDNIAPPATSPRLHPPESPRSHSSDGQPILTSECQIKTGINAQSQRLEVTELKPELPDSEISDSEIDCPLPQSLTHLTARVIDFICDVFDEDSTSERAIPYELESTEVIPQPQRKYIRLERTHWLREPIPRRQWKAFNEQTLFHVLSNPESLIQSFTVDGILLDSHSLWYCMLRLTRASPNLVFHSLWIAAGSLFLPPESVRSAGFQKVNVTRSRQRTLSELEAGCILSICLHALIASVPFCSDTRQLAEMWRIRSRGLASSALYDSSELPYWFREDFDDAFSNNLAIRLARRLCGAVEVWHHFAAAVGSMKGKPNEIKSKMDILKPFIQQIGLSGFDSAPALEFPVAERLSHQNRVQSLALDWVKTVLLDDWDGNPNFAANSPSSGALSFIGSMHKRRELLPLCESRYRFDYLSERLDSMDVPIKWVKSEYDQNTRHLLDYPFLFTPETLVSFFRSINFSRMNRAYEESSSLKTRMSVIVDPGSLITNPHHKTVLQDMLKTASSKYLVLSVDRKHVLRDAFDQLWRREPRELLRPLKVRLGEDGGEEGFDSGGVQQEFFRMAIGEFLEPVYGAFITDDRTRMAWFAPGSVVETWKFELFGLLVSLAVFNGLTLPVTFPKALYRKLLGWPVTELAHIEDGWPDLTSGLTTLQDWDERDGAVEDIFARTYEFSVATYGSHFSRDMTQGDSPWPQAGRTSPDSPTEAGEEAPLVTGKNRLEYVNDYIRYLTSVSVGPQFGAFQRGFRACLDAKSLTLLTPPILQSLVEGVQEINISELREYTRYVGWNASHRTIKDFWSIVKRYDDNMKRRLLEFVTASDRVPVGGMRNLQFVVQKNGEEEGEGGHLPTAYTCYGTLLLPEYRDKEVLRERLGMALQNSQGFGFA
ncbi:hypothetical protein V2G26_006168 [Clonostachys chloroleuca]